MRSRFAVVPLATERVLVVDEIKFATRNATSTQFDDYEHEYDSSLWFSVEVGSDGEITAVWHDQAEDAELLQIKKAMISTVVAKVRFHLPHIPSRTGVQA